jgi:hypothetical protein
MTLIEKIQRLKGDEPLLVEHLVDRLLMGQEPYGIWLAAKERRNLMGDLRDELLDGVAYLCMDAISRANAQRERAACTHADRVWHAMVGEDGFGIVTERVGLPEPTATFDVIDGEVLEVAR